MRPPIFDLRRFALAHLVAFAMLCGSAAGAEDIAPILEEIRQKHDVPALAAAAMIKGELASAGASGLRRLGGKKQVTVDDLWHVGSCTKSMTASVAAMLVDRGMLRWDQTVGDSLGKRCPKMLPEWKGVTVDQLLRHRAGAPPKAPPELWGKAWAQRGTPSAQRWDFVQGLLAIPPASAPEAAFAYSNQGYSIAGQMLEVAAKKPWEELMREVLFKPLDLRSAGFGAPGNAAREDQPWGHQGKTPVPPGPAADNPPAIGPGGTVHLSIKDFARYAAWHASRRGHLSPPQFAKLHTPLPSQDYAMGWHVTERPWAGGKVLTHTGSNTMNFAVMWVAPERDFAVVAATNASGKDAELACDDACAQIIRRFLEKK
jgi:CubicO group peptidase (beta-lactamase class C family)